VLESFSVTSKPRLILAPTRRRRQLLALSDWEFDIIVADVDERQHTQATRCVRLRLAETKAPIASHPDQIILAADTAVVDGSDVLGKPKDQAEAFAMLRRLRGHTHQVYTGVALLRQGDGLLLKELSVTDVPMRDYSDEEIHAYIGTGDPLDKAGAYAIQHSSFQPVINLAGCYTSVMGLPMCHVVRMMHKMRLMFHADVPVQCQTLLSINVPFHKPY
jgi:MAF protein